MTLQHVLEVLSISKTLDVITKEQHEQDAWVQRFLQGGSG